MTTARRDGWSSAVGVSLGLLVIAILVFLLAGDNQSLGPLDLDSADRLALAIWVGAPIAGGLAARTYAKRNLSHAALAVGLVVGLVIALFPASGTGAYTCSLNLPDVPMGLLLGRLVVAGLTGLGMALALLVTGVAAGRLGTAVPGIALAGAVNLGASVAAYQLFYGVVRCLQ